MSSVEEDPSNSNLFVGRITVFVVGRITAVGGRFDVVVLDSVVDVFVVPAVVEVEIGSTTSVAVVVSDKPFSSVTVKLIV